MLTDSPALTPVLLAGMVANDLITTLRFYHEATEAERGDAEALFRHWSARLQEELERPRAGAAGVADAVRRVERVVDGAAAAFAALPSRPGAAADCRDVFLCGDIFLRVDDWGNDDLQRRLTDLGLRVIIEPYTEFFELLALRDVQEHGLTTGKGVKRRLTLRAMNVIGGRLVAAARRHEPWLFWNDIATVEEHSRGLLDGFPFGESIPTIGSALLTWRTRPIDGVVVVGPRGCGPALVSEAQLRRTDMPTLFVYNDGDPLEEARLAGFAWRLRSRPRRAPVG
jgi:predicted nucleotide-binding protein (sugar kinase/HSP70/actin superfamily)